MFNCIQIWSSCIGFLVICYLKTWVIQFNSVVYVCQFYIMLYMNVLYISFLEIKAIELWNVGALVYWLFAICELGSLSFTMLFTCLLCCLHMSYISMYGINIKLENCEMLLWDLVINKLGMCHCFWIVEVLQFLLI